MARHFEITELKSSIRISVAEELPVWGRILAGLIAAAAALSSSQCILPFVGHSDAMDVIRAIQKKFPGSAETWQVAAGVSEHFLTLGLDKGK